jgi:NADP-dependent 3-hydroxy acid dehydrogenase YdfG
VVVATRRSDGPTQLALELTDVPGRVVPSRADVTVEAEVRAMVATAVAAFSDVGVLVNDAGSEVQGRFPRPR